jgi:hypothetical protein
MAQRWAIVRVKIHELDGDLDRILVGPSDDFSNQSMTIPMRDCLGLEPIQDEIVVQPEIAE